MRTGAFTRHYLRHEPLPSRLAAKAGAEAEDQRAEDLTRPHGLLSLIDIIEKR